MNPNLDQAVREIAIKNPGSVRVFESLGIDYCCGGKRSLGEACQRANVPEEVVLQLLAAATQQVSEDDQDWAEASIKDLAAHVVQDHHGYIRRESPSLITMLQKVVDRHGAGHPELKSIQELFSALVDELMHHMMKEERVLFPHLESMEAASKEGRALPAAMFGSVEVPISRMLADHDDAGELLGRIRTLSSDFRPPAGACTTYRALYQGLKAFDHDLRQHVHLENNILFPRALVLERKESADAGS